MSQAPAPHRSLIVTLLGVLTLLYALSIIGFWGYAFAHVDDALNLMGRLVNAEADAVKKAGGDEKKTDEVKGQANDMIGMMRNMFAVLCGIFIFIGLIGLLGGVGMTFRTGRVMAIVFALLNAAVGGGALKQGLDKQMPILNLWLPIVLLTYGALTVLVLLFTGREFQRTA